MKNGRGGGEARTVETKNHGKRIRGVKKKAEGGGRGGGVKQWEKKSWWR